MSYTINKLAKMAKVSVRALHYYDQIGLLKPAKVGENGYRYYEERELLRLQQILFFRELEFPLEEIRQVLDSPSFDLKTALLNHKKYLEIKRRREGELIRTIEKTIKKIEGEKMEDEELYEGFDKEKMKEYEKEAEERWGNTEAYKQSRERVKNFTKEDWKKIQEEGEEINKGLVKEMDKGIESGEVQALVARHYAQICRFYDCPMEMYKGLAQMYVTDERFAEHYRQYHPDLAQFFSRAMIYFADHNSKQK